MALGLGIIAAVGAVFGAVEAHKQTQAQKRQNKITNRIAATKRARDIKRAVALNRIKAGELQAAGFQFGVAGSTQVSGAVGSLRSDQASAIGASNQQFTGQQVLSSVSDEIAQHGSNIATAGAVTSIAGGLAGNQQFTNASDKFFAGFTG